MISDERLHFKLKNPDICTHDEIEMAKELLALRKLFSNDEVIVALKRIECYEDVDDEILADDAMLNAEPWPEWRVIRKP